MDKTKKLMTYAFVIFIVIVLIYASKKRPNISTLYTVSGMYACNSGDDERCKGDIKNFLAITLIEDSKEYYIHDFYTDKDYTPEKDSMEEMFPDSVLSKLPREYSLIDSGRYELDIEDITFKSESGKIQKAKINKQIIDYEFDGKKMQFKKFTNATNPIWISSDEPE